MVRLEAPRDSADLPLLQSSASGGGVTRDRSACGARAGSALNAVTLGMFSNAAGDSQEEQS